jgi:3-phenylpropionate/trans-cinnamate dioxygenase ferredoxin reductase subunit
MMNNNYNTDPIVIVGAGHSGGRAALALREEGYQGSLILIGEELHAPYERPPLSKQALQGGEGSDDYFLKPKIDYAQLDIDLKLGVEVTALDPAARAISLSDGGQLHYSKLVLATGGKVRTLPLPGIELEGVHYLRTLNDATNLRNALNESSRLVVIGGGFIGLEVAASARKLGCEVVVLEAADRLAGRALPEEISERLLALQRANGVDVTLNCRIESIEGQGNVESVLLQDGSRIPCDRVLIGVGIEPNVELAQQAGLETGNGIRVNDRLQSSDENIYAIGDVCEFPCPQSGLQVRHETWRNAEQQAHLIARNLLGQDEAFQAPLWFWSDQFDCSLQMVGASSIAQHTVQRELPDNGILLFYIGAENRLVAVSGFGRGNSVAKDIKVAELLIGSGKSLNPEFLANPAIKLKSLLKG